MHELSGGGACTQAEISPEVGKLAAIAMREFEAVRRILPQVNAATELARTLTGYLTVPRLSFPGWPAVELTAGLRSVRRTHGMAAHLRTFRGTAIQIEAFFRATRPLTTVERTLVLRPGTLEAAWVEFLDAWCGLLRAERRARRARTDATRAGARQVIALATARLDRAMETLLRRRDFVSARAARAYVARRRAARRRGQQRLARYLAFEPGVSGEIGHAADRGRGDIRHRRAWHQDQEPAIGNRERLQAFRLALHEIGAGRQRIRFQGSCRSAACRRGRLFADPQVAVPRELFGRLLERIARLRPPHPAPC
jgi:hypothetical protein